MVWKCHTSLPRKHGDGRKKTTDSLILKDQRWWSKIITIWVELIYLTCYSRCIKSAIGRPNSKRTSFSTALVWLWWMGGSFMVVTWVRKEFHKKKQMPLISFQSAIASSHLSSLCQARKTSAWTARSWGRPFPNSPTPVTMPSKKRKSSSVPNLIEDVRLDQCGHFPVYEEKQQRCRLCKTGYSHLKCRKCDVYLYLVKSRKCFDSFHGLSKHRCL